MAIAPTFERRPCFHVSVVTECDCFLRNDVFPMLLEDIRLPSDARYPVTVAQDLILATLAIHPTTSVFQMPSLGFRFAGATVQEETIVFILKYLIRRHCAFRLRFEPCRGLSTSQRDADLLRFRRTGLLQTPLHTQVLLDVSDVELSTADLRGFSDSCRDHEFRRLYGVEQRRPFTYSQPLLRAWLVRLAEQDSIVVLFVDHMVADGRSMKLLAFEFGQLFLDHAFRCPQSTSPADHSFLEFAKWQAEACSLGAFRKEMLYWRQQWVECGGGRVLPEDLPFTLPHRDNSERPFGAIGRSFGHSVSAEIIRFARRSEITIHTLFVAVVALTLNRYTGKDVLGIWMHFANRARLAWRRGIGWFANTHLIGIRIEENRSGDDLLKQVRSSVLNGIENQQLPLGHMWQVLRCHPRFRDANILVDFNSRRTGDSPHFLTDGGTLRRIDLPDESTPRLSTLGVYVDQQGQDVSVRIRYATSLYPDEAMETVLHDLQVITQLLITSPDSSLGHLMSSVAPRVDPSRASNGAGADFVVTGTDLIPAI